MFVGFVWFLFVYIFYNVSGVKGLLYFLLCGREKLLFCVMGNDISSIFLEVMIFVFFFFGMVVCLFYWV